MNQGEFIEAVGVRAAISNADARRVLEAAADAALEALMHGEEVPLPGIGKLGTKERAASKGRNPRTGEAIDIPAKRTVTFKPAKSLRDAIPQPVAERVGPPTLRRAVG